MARPKSYLMENIGETLRLEVKTDPQSVREQGDWCGLKPGIRVLDAGCGPGKVTSILHEMTQPGGEIVGVDSSKERLLHAKKKYGNKPGIEFARCDLKKNDVMDLGQFDLIWVRFILEYYKNESFDIVKNLTKCLKPGGYMCLIDLDNNCLNHYKLTKDLEEMLKNLMDFIEEQYDFDPYAGRKLYSYLFELGYEQIQIDLKAHHLFYGKIKDEDVFNWIKKVEMISNKAEKLFEKYPGGYKNFFNHFNEFIRNPKRFTYTPLILCKGMKPL